MEASGVVIEIGKNVTNFKPGDKVCHCMNIGSFSKKFVVNQNKVIKLDDKTDLKIAASATLQGLTAQYLLHHSWSFKEKSYIAYSCCFRWCWSIALPMGKVNWCKYYWNSWIKTEGKYCQKFRV